MLSTCAIAGFETLQPEHGLAVLAAALSAAVTTAAPVAGPLLWDALLRSGTPRAGNPLYIEFAAVAPSSAEVQDFMPMEGRAASQPAPHRRLSMLTLRRSGHRQQSTRAMVADAQQSRGRVGDGKARTAEVLARVLAILHGVVGEGVAPDQPLMEVGLYILTTQHQCSFTYILDTTAACTLLCVA